MRLVEEHRAIRQDEGEVIAPGQHDVGTDILVGNWIDQTDGRDRAVGCSRQLQGDTGRDDQQGTRRQRRRVMEPKWNDETRVPGTVYEIDDLIRYGGQRPQIRLVWRASLEQTELRLNHDPARDDHESQGYR